MSEDTAIAAPANADALGLKPELAHYLPLEAIRPSPYNPRKRFDEARLDELADSIASQGVMQAIVVRKVTPAKPGGAEYEIVAGERRWRACSVLVKRGFNRPHVIPAFIRELDDFQAREVALTENSNRHDLHPLEEAQAYENLLLKPVGGGEFKPPRLKGYTVEQLADKIGHKPNFVFGRLKLLQLVPAAREAFLADKLQLKIAEALARLPAGEQDRAVADILRGWAGEPFTHRQAIAHLRQNFMLLLKSAPFGITDKDLVANAGPCTTCPKRSGASPDLFGENADDMCLDSACFDAKKKAQADQVIAKARDAGHTVLVGAAAEKVLGKGHTVTADYYLKNTGHIDLDKPAPELTGTRKTLRSLLGDEISGKTIVVQGEGDDQPTNVAKVSDVKAALRAKGIEPAAVKNGKKITPEDIEKQREERLDELMGKRVHSALMKHFDADKSTGFPDESAAWMRWLAWQLINGCDADVDELRLVVTGTAAGDDQWLQRLDAEKLCRVVMALVIGEQLKIEYFPHYGVGMSSDPKVANGLAKEIGFDLPAFRKEMADEIDATIRDEIQALADVVAPAAKKTTAAKKGDKAAAGVKYRDPATGATWSGKGLQPKWLKVALQDGKTLADFDASTPASNAAAQGKESPAAKSKKNQLTPEKALADAVAKEAGVDRTKLEAKPAKKTAKPKTEQKDETAKPPATTAPKTTLSPAAAWPFPTGPSKTAEAQA